MNQFYLGLGSNLGQKENNIDRAIDLLNLEKNIEIIDVAENAIFKADIPAHFGSQPDYMNTVAIGMTILSPEELFAVTQNIEKLLGRENKGDYQPRYIDIDILFYNNDILSTEKLIIPHPRLHERRFVLEPLQQLAPHLMHPILEKSVQELLDQLNGRL